MTAKEALDAIKTGLADMLASGPHVYLVGGCECPTSNLSTVVAYDADTGFTLYS